MALVFLYDEHTKTIAREAIKILQDDLKVCLERILINRSPEQNYDQVQAICSELTNIAMQLKNQAVKAASQVEVKN
jgi:hypothetical protein